ncbi:protein of unknown function [Burkholderia multivorans]
MRPMRRWHRQMVTDGRKARSICQQALGYGARRRPCVTGAAGRFTVHYVRLAARGPLRPRPRPAEY